MPSEKTPQLTDLQLALNLVLAAKLRPIVIQSLFMQVNGIGPTTDEITAYIARLHEIIHAGGQITRVQVYTVARPPAESFVSAMPGSEVQAIADRVSRELGLAAEAY